MALTGESLSEWLREGTLRQAFEAESERKRKPEGMPPEELKLLGAGEEGQIFLEERTVFTRVAGAGSRGWMRGTSVLVARWLWRSPSC